MENQPTNPVVTPEPSAQPAPVATPPKKSKKGLIIGIIVGVAVVVVGIVLAIVFLFQGVMNSGSAEATSFVDHLKNNRLTEAYEYFSPQLREVQDFDTFSAQVGTLGLNPSCEYKASSAEVNAGTSGNTKETAGRIECDSKAFTAEFKFIKIDSVFKLTMYQITPTTTANTNNNSNNNNNSSNPKDMEALRVAMINKEALNCVVTHPTEGNSLIQTNKGWTKMFMRAINEGVEENILIISGDGIYTWNDENAYKIAYEASFMDDIVNEMDLSNADLKDAKDYTLNCSNPTTSNFRLPSGIEFVDIADLQDY